MMTLFWIGFISAFVSSMSGTGASLFATPLFLSVGVNLTAILAFNQISAAIWTPIASRTYRLTEPLNKKLIAILAGVGVFGVGFGYKLAIFLPPEHFKPIIGSLILMVVVIVWFRPIKPLKREELKGLNFITLLLAFLLGAYQAFFGAGNALFNSLMFNRSQGFDFKRALAHAYACAFVWCSISAILYWMKGWVSWSLVIPAVAGSILGATLGSRYGSKLSNTTLKKIFLLGGGLMGVRLLF